MSTELIASPNGLPGQGIEFGDLTALISAAGGNNGASGTWNVSITGTTTSGFPSGCILPIYAATAPPNWTKVTTHNDKVMRVVNTVGGGSGGTVPFSTWAVNGSVPVSGADSQVTLNQNQIPSHSHSSTESPHSHGGASSSHGHQIIDPGHNHGVGDRTHAHNSAPYADGYGYGQHSHQFYGIDVAGLSGISYNQIGVNAFPAPGGLAAVSTATSFYGQTDGINQPLGLGTNPSGAGYSIQASLTYLAVQPGGSSISTTSTDRSQAGLSGTPSGAHNHTFSSVINTNFQVLYADFILCQKN